MTTTTASEIRLATIAHSLRSCRLFASLQARDLESLASFVIPRELARGTYLFREGEPVDGFFVVERGAISVHRNGPSGKEQVIHVFREGESFAEAAVAGGGIGYPADARAVEASRVLLVPTPPFLELLARRPEMVLWMLATLSAHMKLLVSRIDDLTLKDVETRLACWILRQLPAGRNAIQLDRTKRVLAAELGTTSETLSRTFARYTEGGVIRVQGRTIEVLDRDRLRGLVDRTTIGGTPNVPAATKSNRKPIARTKRIRTRK